MYADFFYWHYVLAPQWLARFSWNVQRVLWRWFSVSAMLRTLVAHWRRDVVPYRGGTFSNIVLTWAWNSISRAIGFLIRTTILCLWASSTAIAAGASLLVMVFFLAWPLLTVVLLATGLALL